MLKPEFFQRDVLTVARDLIGVELFWRGCVGIIVETEAYAAEGDEASHLITRPSARAFIKDHPAGTAYVYFNYGMYWMLNLLVKGGEQDGLILIRGLEPRKGLDLMQERRIAKLPHQLCSGPGKLASALGITGADHGMPLVGKAHPKDCGMRLNSDAAALDVVSDIRVGISKAADLPWRFLAKNNPHVSVPYGRVKPYKRSSKPAIR